MELILFLALAFLGSGAIQFFVLCKTYRRLRPLRGAPLLLPVGLMLYGLSMRGRGSFSGLDTLAAAYVLLLAACSALGICVGWVVWLVWALRRKKDCKFKK